METLLICGDFNSYIGKAALGYKGVHGGYGFCKRNIDGEKTLGFAVAKNLVVKSSKFVKKENHLITYQSGGCSSQVDFILLQATNFN